MNDWEKKERFSYPTGKESVERHPPDEAPGFSDKYGALMLFWIAGIVLVGTLSALGFCIRLC